MSCHRVIGTKIAPAVDFRTNPATSSWVAVTLRDDKQLMSLLEALEIPNDVAHSTPIALEHDSHNSDSEVIGLLKSLELPVDPSTPRRNRGVALPICPPMERGARMPVRV